MEPIVLVSIAVVVFVWLRIVAARRVAAGDARFVWVVFAPTLLIGAALVWTSAIGLTTIPIMGVVFAIAAVVYLLSGVRATMRAMTGVAHARTQDEFVSAVTDPFVEHMVVLISLALIGGVVGLVVLIAWGVSRAAG